LAGSSEHIIKIQSQTDNTNNSGTKSKLDTSSIGSGIEESIGTSIRRQLEEGLSKAFSNIFVNYKDQPKSADSLTYTLAKDIKDAVASIVVKNATSASPVDSKAIQVEIASAIKDTVSSKLNDYFKTIPKPKGPIDNDRVVHTVASKVSSYDTSEISKILQAFSALSKDLAHIPDLIAELKKEKSKDAPDVSKITSLTENIISKASDVKDSYKVLRPAIKKLDDTNTTGTVDKLSGMNNALTRLVKKLSDKEVVVKVSADVSQAEKEIKSIEVGKSNIVVTADTTKVENQMAKLLGQDIMSLSIDLEKDEIPAIYNRITALKSKISDLNEQGISLGIDTKALQELQNRLTKIVQGFDYVKGSLGKEQYNKISELNKLPSREDTVKLPAVNRSGVEARRDILEKRIAELESTRVSMNSVVDRKESSYITNDKSKVSDVLTIENDFAKLGKVPDIKASLSNQDFGKLVKSDRSATTLQDITSIEALIKDFNTSISKLSTEIPTQDNAKLIQSLDKNTAALDQSKLADAVDKFKTEASKSQYALASAEKAIGIKYAERFIQPAGVYTAPDKVTNEYELKVYDNMSKLASSLDNLQKTIYTRVSEGLKSQPGKQQFTDWKVVENEGSGNVHNRAFNLRGKDWAMDIVDMKKLRSLTGQQEGTPKELLKLYTDKLSTNLLKEKDQTPSSVKLELAEWFRSNIKSGGVQSLSSDVRDTVGRDVLDQLDVSSIGSYSAEDLSKVFDKTSRESLKSIYSKTVGFSKIEEALSDVKRTISVPAAKLTNTGSTVLETQYGSNRSTLQLAEYKTGYERAFEGYIKNMETVFNKLPENQKETFKSASSPEIVMLAKAVRTFGFNKSERDIIPETDKTYEDVSKILLKGATLKDGAPSKEAVVDIYKKALVPVSIEKQRVTKGTSKEISAKEEYVDLSKQVDQALSSTESIDDFMASMSSMGLSATKVIKSLDSLNFSNVYDTIDRATAPKIDKIVGNIATSSGAIGDFEKTIASLEGMMPIVEQNAPRRGMHQGDTVSAVFNYSKAFDLPSNASSNLLTDAGKNIFNEQKSLEDQQFSSSNEAKKAFITDFNRRTNELFYESANLPAMEEVSKETSYRKALLNTNNNNQLTSLGLPESPASNLEVTPGSLNRSGLTVPMYTGNLREIAPFSLEYQQTGRNISGISSAKSFDTGLFGKSQGISSEFPKLRSESEDKVIQAGRFGKSGIGYNVLAELRHTAGTFEDQILVSGKLADAATTAVRKLVRPKASAGKASAINEGPLKDSDIEEVSGNIMSIMGIDEKYKRRPDKAFIKDVRTEVSTNRGSSLEVQTAKLAELFFNHFGRKLTTRYGSKGVSVTPTSPSTLGDILSQNQGSSVKVLTEEAQKKAGLGVAFMPKSMGDLSADILNQQDEVTKNRISSDIGMNVSDLAKELQESGNKFILDIFTDVSKGLVTEEEAIKNTMVFDKAKKAFASLDIDLENNIKGIETIKSAHTGDKTIAKAIDVRISSYGAAKRGLQTEPLEIIANNLAGSSNKTVLKNTIDDKNTGLISGKSGGLFSKYSKSLGFSGADKTDEELYKQISSMYSEDKLKDKDVQEAIKAMIELEKKSNYYVEVVDELNKRRKSLVGDKFLSIVEEPTQTEEWSKGAIESLNKGIKLNIPAYAAYTSIFGEDSAFMKDVNENFTDKQAEHYDNILTYLVNSNKDYQNKVLSSISSIDLKDLKSVNKDTIKTFNEGDPGSLLGSIFDTDAFPASYKTIIPSTKGKEEAGEELYIPRSISRTTYSDPMRAGAYGIKKTGSKLQDVIDKSRSLKAFYEKDPEYLLETDIAGMAGAFGSTTAKSLSPFFGKTTSGGSTGIEKADNEEAFNKLNQVKKDLLNLLLKFEEQDVLSKDSGSLNKSVQKFYNGPRNTSGKFDLQDASESSFVKYLSTPEGFNSPTALAAMKNMLIGTGKANEVDTSVLAKATDNKTKLSVMQGITKAVGDEGSMFSYGIGSSQEEKYNNQVKKRQESLEKAKEDYAYAIKNSLIGKKGSVARTFFTRNIPAVLAKGVTATVDKTEDLTLFSESLKDISGLDLTSEIGKIESLTSEHAANVAKYKEIGMPVLKQHELGISSKLAEKLKVNFTKKYDETSGMPLGVLQGETSGSLKDLISYSDKLKETANKHTDPKHRENINEYIEKEVAPYVESVRFPFTGTSSVKPYKAKLMNTAGGIGDDSLIVPGTPEMDMGAFEEVYNSLKDKIKTLSSERESARIVGDDTKADSLTATIDKLNEAISAVLPKYVAHAQKLDFDGDQIEVHTAKTSEARNDIYKHFKMLTTDIDSTAGKFSDFYSYDAKQPSQGELPLSFMSKAFSKKFDSSKGYSFLDKPFTTEDLSYLSPKEKISILASKEQDLNMASGGESVSRVMRDVYEKVGVKFDDSVIRNIEDLGEASAEAVAQIGQIKDLKIKSFIEGNIREELSNIKLDTAVNAQLFKINTGTDVESMTKLMRAYESKIGYDESGEVNYATKPDSGKLDQGFVTRERNTQLNEFFRFAVQKGMDVKHAGERPIAGELVKGVTTGNVGLSSLLQNLEKNKSYADLKTFKNINEESLRNTFGKFSTTDLKEQAISSGITQKDISGISREDLINSLVKKLGFEGFLVDLQQTIEQQAIKGMQATSDKPLSPQEAYKKLQKNYERGNSINVGRLITNVQDPLYKFRSSGASVDKDFDEQFTSALGSIKDTYGGKGAYSELVRNFASLNKTSIDKNVFNEAKATLYNTPKESFLTGEVSMNSVKDFIGGMENTLGLAPLSERKQAGILTSPEHVANLQNTSIIFDENEKVKAEKYNDRLGNFELLKARLDRIESLATFEETQIQPKVRPDISVNTTREEITKASIGVPKDTEAPLQLQELSNKLIPPSTQSSDIGMPPISPTLPPKPPTIEGDLSSKSGGVIPVYLEGMNSSLIFPVKLIGQLLESANIINKQQQSFEGFKSEDSDIPNIKETVDKFKTTEEQRKTASARAQTLEPYAGHGPNAELANLKLLRTASKSLYEARGMDFNNEAKKLTQEAQDYISSAKDIGGIDVSEFLKYTQNARIMNQQDENQGMSGQDISTAWRLYKDAVIEYLVKKAEDAEEAYQSVSGMGGSEEASAYDKFATSVNAIQKRIIADTGKRSDIYTANKVWAFPDIAKAAGVYQSPIDIQRKSNRDLGGDDDPDSELLRKVFDNITNDLSGKSRGGILAPQDKARSAIKELTEMNEETVALMNNGRLLERLGPEIAEAWDFKAAAERITRLRSALELFKQFNVSDTPLSVEKKNLEDTIKLLKDAENKLSKADMGNKTKVGGSGVWGDTGVIAVPKWADPKMQSDMHKRNISKLREYYTTPESEGGAKIGERYAYDTKVFDDVGKPVENQRTLFHKFSETVDSAGQKIGLFSTKQEDLAASLAGTNRGFIGAIERAVKWGAASTVVYGGVTKLKEAVDTVAEIETGMAQLKMVMPSVGTDFEGMQQSATSMAKKYGAPTTGVLDSMVLYAQQGLSQSDVVERTETSMLAGNVTTLNAKEATEALTAAMKVFRAEGENSIRFLDSWSEVEAKHAITSGDMAQAIMKAAAAASTAGINFDQLNGIVAAIGSVTRQSGKEVGTSLRFIMRRLSSEKGPDYLAKLNIPTITGEGELRGGFDILSNLADKWKELNSAQKMAVAQAIGGTRQYNSLLVLMDNWQEALDGVHHSMNAQGSATRRNSEIMQTYSKQVEQTKASFVELQTAFGKVAFPIAKLGLQGMKALAETISAIPTSFKVASVAALGLFTYLSQGAKVLNTISDFFSGGAPVMGGLISSIKDELKTASFEILGAGSLDDSSRGLKTIIGSKVEGRDQGKSIRDFESGLGKAAYLLVSAGKSFNDTVGGGLQGTGKAGQSIGQATVRGSSWLSSVVSSLGGGNYGNGEDVTYKDLVGGAASKYSKSEGVKGAFAAGGLKGFGKLASNFVGVATEVAGLGGAAAGIFVDEFSKKLGAGGDMFKAWAEDNTGVVKAVAPMLLTIGLLTPALKALGKEFMDTTRSSHDFANSMYGLIEKDETSLSQIRDTKKYYGDLQKKVKNISDSESPETKSRQKYLGTYTHPLTALTEVQTESLKLGDTIAKSNINMISGYDNLGNAILRTTDNYKTLLDTFERSKIRDIASKDSQVVAKHIEALTKTDGAEGWKSELKDLTKEIPVIGEMISNQISVSPAKSLEILTGKLNNLVSRKNASPMSTIYDDDITNLQGKLSKVKDSFNHTYSEFKRTLAEIPTAGLGRDEIANIFSADSLKAGYKLMLEVEPEFNVKGVKEKITQGDVLGAEVMRRVFPENSLMGATKELSIANAESKGLASRQGKVLSGDLVTFTDDVTDKFNMSGKQAVVKLKETSDGIFEWVATYFNTKTLKIEDRKFDSNLQDLVENILPTKAIEQDMSDRIEALSTFVTGASAGLVGIAKKGFKSDFNLGERFFSDISTSTLIQGDKGFNPLEGFGESKLQTGWADDFEKYYNKPLQEYKTSLEELEKMHLEGLDAGSTEMSTSLYESLVKLQNILKNNQVVLQYRAVFADLTKTMDANTRAIKENIAIEKTRSSLSKETGGLLKGKDISLANIDLGKYNKSELTAQERLLLKDDTFSGKANKLKELDIKKTGTAEQLYAIERSKVALDSIKELSAGFGTSLSTDDLSKYTETVAKTGDLGIAELKIDTSNTAENTAKTVDKLDEILSNLEDKSGAKDMESSFKDALDFILPSLNITKNERLGEALDRVASIRNESVSSGDNATTIKANAALDSLTKQLVDSMGLEGAVNKVNSGVFGSGDFKGEELVQRAFGGLDFKTLSSEMKSKMPDETSWFGLFSKKGTPSFDKTTEEVQLLQEENRASAKNNSLFSSKNLAGAATGFGVYQAFNTNFSNKKIEAYEKEIAALKERENEIGFVEYGPQMSALTSAKAEEEKKARMYGTMRYAAGGASGSMLLARNLGMSEDNIKRLGAGGAALGVYGAAKLQQGMTGDDLPPIVKDFGKEVTIFFDTMKNSSGGFFSKIFKEGPATSRFKGASEDFMKQFAEETLDLKATPSETAKDRDEKYNAASDAFTKTKDDFMFDAEWKAKELKRTIENPNADLRSKTSESVGQMSEDAKNKLAALKEYLKTYSQDTIKSAEDKMARGQENNLGEEASQVFEGVKVKSKEAYSEYKDKFTEASDFAGKTKDYASEMSLGALDALVEALLKNTEAVNNNTSTEGGKAFGGFVQRFADGGTVKQIMPGSGDKQPSLLTAGEEVLTAEQHKKLKPFLDIKILNPKPMDGGFSSGGTTVGKTAAKKLPGLGTAIAAASATGRVMAGDYLGAGLEMASGLVSNVPVLGTAASFILDGALLGNDLLSNKTPSLEDIRNTKSGLQDRFNEVIARRSGRGFATGGLLGQGPLKERIVGLSGKGKLALLAGALGTASLFGDSEEEKNYATGGFIYTGLKGLGKLSISGLSLGAAGLFGVGKGLKSLFSSNLSKKTYKKVSESPVFANNIDGIYDNYNKFKENSPKLYEAIATGTMGTLGLSAANNIYNYEKDEDIYGNYNAHGGLINSFAGGGYTTGLIAGPGTGTSDSIPMSDVPEGSFIVPSKYAQKAKDQIELASGGRATSNIKVSNGEYFIAPEDASEIGEENLKKLQHGQKTNFSNGGIIKRFAEGGTVTSAPDSVIAIDQESINRLAQASAAAAAFTFSRYASEKTADKTRAVDLSNMAEGENTAIYEAIMTNSEAAQKVYSDLNVPQTSDNTSEVETEEVSKVLDTNKEYNKILEEQRNIEKSLIAEHNTYNEEISKLKEEMHKVEIAEKFAMEIEAMNKAIKDNQIAENFKRSLKIGTGAFEGFNGPRDIDLTTKGVTDLNSMELLQLVGKRKKDQQDWYKPSTYINPVKNFGLRMVNYVNPEDTYNNKYRGQNVLKEYGKLEDKKTMYTSVMNNALQNRSQAADEDTYDKWNKVLEDTKDNLEKVVSKQDGYSVALREQARATDKAMHTLTRFKEATITVSNIKTEANYGFNNRGMGNRLRGAISDISLLPSGVEDLNNQQYAHMQAGTTMRGTITQHKVNTELYNQLMQEVKIIEADKAKRESDRVATSDRGWFFKDNEPQKIDNDIANFDKRATDAKEKLEGVGRALELTSQKISNFYAVTDAAKSFETSINAVKSSMYSAAKGAEGLQTKLNNMYGGSGAFAPQLVDINQRQEAAKYSVKLELGKSNQFDVEKANLLKTINGPGDYQTRYDAWTAYANLNKKKEDYIKNEELLKNSQKVRESVQPGQDYLTAISIARTKINERLLSNEYPSDEARQEDTKSLAVLDKGFEAMLAKLESVASSNTPATDLDLSNMRDIIANITKGVGGATVKDLEESKGLSENPIVNGIQTQTKELLEGLINKNDLEEIKKLLHVEESPSTFSTVAKWFKPRETGPERIGPWADELASGGSVGRIISGPGTGTSDSINMAVPSGSFIIKAKYAQAAKNALNTFADGGQVPIKVSNGELLLAPAEVQNIGGTKVAEAFNSGNFTTKGYATGGSISKKLEDEFPFADQYHGEPDKPLETPMFDPVDLLPIAGFSGILKAIAGKATTLLPKITSKSAVSYAGSYLDEARGIMGTNLDVSKYTKDILNNDKVLQGVLEKGRSLYGADSSLTQIVTRSGAVTLKNMAESTIAPNVLLPKTPPAFKLEGYLQEAQRIMGTNLDVSKYTKEIVSNEEIYKAVLNRGKSLYGGDVSLPNIVTRQGAVNLKNMVDDISVKGYAVGGQVLSKDEIREKLQKRVLGPTKDDLTLDALADVITKNQSLLGYVKSFDVSSAKDYGKSETAIVNARRSIDDPNTKLWFNENYVQAANVHKISSIYGDTDKAKLEGVVARGVGHIAAGSLRKDNPEKYALWMDKLGGIASSRLTEYAAKARTSFDEGEEDIPRDEVALAEIFRLHNASGSKKSFMDLDPAKAIAMYYPELKTDEDDLSVNGVDLGNGLMMSTPGKDRDQLRKQLINTGDLPSGNGVGLGNGLMIDDTGLTKEWNAAKSGVPLNSQKVINTTDAVAKLQKGEDIRTPILSEGLDINKIAEKFTPVLSTEQTMIPKNPLITSSETDLQDEIKGLVGPRDAAALSARNIKSDIEKYKLTYTTSPEEAEAKKSKITMLEEALKARTASIYDYEAQLNKPTTSLIAKQFDATTMGVKANRPEHRWSDIKGPVIMTAKGFVPDNLNRGPDILTEMRDRAAFVSKDSPEKSAYLAKLKPEERAAFLKSSEIALRNTQTLIDAGGLKTVVTNQNANFMMGQAKENYLKTFEFYADKNSSDIKAAMIAKHGSDTYEKMASMRAFNTDKKDASTAAAFEAAKNNPELRKRLFGGLPDSMTLTKEVQELIRQLKEKQDKNNKETITRNNDNPNTSSVYDELNNLSRQVKHNGGMAHKSGSYFLEGGEVILPKGFAEGGNVTSESLISRQTGTGQGVEITGLDSFDRIVKTLEKSLDKLTNIKIEGIDKLTDIKIEGLSELKNIQIDGIESLKNIQIEGVESLKNIQIEGVESLKNIQIEGVDKLTNIKIEGIESLKNIQIEGVEKLTNIKVEGADQLRDINIIGIDELKDVSVKSSAVGADSSDMLADALKDFDSRVINLERGSEDQVSIIKSMIDEAIASTPTKDMDTRSDIDDLRKNFMTTSSEVSNLHSSMKRLTQEISESMSNFQSKQNTLMTHVYSIKRV